MRNSIILAFLILQMHCFGSNLSVEMIPDSLKENANAVVRFNIKELEQNESEKITLNHKYAITILNEEGMRFAHFNAFANDFIDFKFIEGSVLNEEGLTISVLNKKDINLSTISTSNFKTDGKNYSYFCNYKHFPFTVVYSYQLVLHSNFFESGVDFVPDYHVSVQQASYQYHFPKGGSFNFLDEHFDRHVVKTVESIETIKWELSNYCAISKEPYSPDISTFTPGIVASPKQFSMEGNTGRLDSWEEFGNFIHTLNKGRQQVSTELLQKINVIAPISLPEKERAKRIYKYVQDNYRYVSIQLGIGGWQPIPAIEVEKNGFGDCKGLSNLVLTLLKEAGIKSNYVLVGAGDTKKLNRVFPSNTFDHIILMLPFPNDTTWLECTSNVCPFGYLGDFTSNRDVLVIGEHSYVTHTPTYSHVENTQTSTSIYNIEENNLVNIAYKITFRSSEYDNILNTILGDHEQKIKFINNNFSARGLVIDQYDFFDASNNMPQMTIDIGMHSNTFINSTDKRLFVPTNLYKTKLELLQNDSERETPIYINESWSQSDTIIIKGIEKLVPEESLAQQVVSYPFGKYNYSIEMKENEIIFIRHIECYEGVYPASFFGDFYTFITKASKLFNKTLALKKSLE